MTNREEARAAEAPLLCEVCRRDHPERAALAAFVREGLRAEQPHEDILSSVMQAGTPAAVARHLLDDVLGALLGDATDAAPSPPSIREPSLRSRGSSVPTDPLPPSPLAHDRSAERPGEAPSPVPAARLVVRRRPISTGVEGAECPACGAAAPTGGQFCSACGASLAPRPLRRVRAPEPERTSRAAAWPTPHPAAPGTDADAADAAGSGLSCPSCASEVAAAWIACPRCGEALARTCPACGKVVEEDWCTCPWCATDITPEAT